jgi:hypothetical protein
MKHFSLVFGLLLLHGAAWGQTTWAADVAPIIYQHCTTCHRSGGVGNFPLETFWDSDNNADAMLYAIQSGSMPPYPANPDYRHFKEENVLTDAEVQTIVDWIDGGKVVGDLTQAPALPNFQNGSQLTSVDLALETPMFTIYQETDIYRAFIIPSGVTTDQYFNEIEFIPGNNAIIHHVVLYSDETDEGVNLDLADPGPGWSTNGMVGGITENATLIGEWTPGGTPIKMPSQFGYKIPANSYFIVEIHFAPNHLNQTDPGSLVNIRLNPDATRQLYYGVLVSADSTYGLLNPPFIIPANTVHTLQSEQTVENLAGVPLSLFTLTPHAHVFGKSFKAYGYYENNDDTIPLIDIPQWDFYWQGTYTLQKPLKMPTSMICHADVTYDNTVNNPNQPSATITDVHWGEKTTNEMLFLFGTVAVYQNGDENIILDSILLQTPSADLIVSDERFTIVNPLDQVLDVKTSKLLPGRVDFAITNIAGQLVRQWREDDLQHSRTSVESLTPGTYILQIRHANTMSSFQLLKR